MDTADDGALRGYGEILYPSSASLLETSDVAFELASGHGLVDFGVEGERGEFVPLASVHPLGGFTDQGASEGASAGACETGFRRAFSILRHSSGYKCVRGVFEALRIGPWVPEG